MMTIKKNIGAASVTGTARGSDNKPLQHFHLQVKNDSGEIIWEQNFDTGTWTIDPVAGYEYWFDAMPTYGAIMIMGEQLFNGLSVVIPINYSGNSTSDMNIYYGIAGGLALWLLLDKKKKKVGKVTTEDIIPVVIIGGVVIGFDLLKKTFESLGIWTSADSKQLDNQAANPDSYWSPTYYTQFSTYSYAIDTAQAQQLSDTIYDSFGAFNDCEECVIAAFRTLKTKANVSFLAKVFADKYGQDLLTFLRGGVWPQDRLSDSDVATIDSFLSKLPNN